MAHPVHLGAAWRTSTKASQYEQSSLVQRGDTTLSNGAPLMVRRTYSRERRVTDMGWPMRMHSEHRLVVHSVAII